MGTRWTYEKMGDDGNIKYCPVNDPNGEITGKFIMNLREYFDENPAERIRLGWIKHIRHDPAEILYNKQTHYLIGSNIKVDEYTIEDNYHVFEKTEEMMLLEEMLEAMGYTGGISLEMGGFMYG